MFNSISVNIEIMVTNLGSNLAPSFQIKLMFFLALVGKARLEPCWSGFMSYSTFRHSLKLLHDSEQTAANGRNKWSTSFCSTLSEEKRNCYPGIDLYASVCLQQHLMLISCENFPSTPSSLVSTSAQLL